MSQRVIYLLVVLALGIPLTLQLRVPPAELHQANRFFEVIEEQQPEPGKVVLMAFDFGPNLMAENGPQAEVAFEHLMRRRIPVVLFSIYVQAEPFLRSIPERVVTRLEAEMPGERWQYGRDWVNVGYRPGPTFVIVQGIARATSLAEHFGTDIQGNRLVDLPIFRGVGGLESVPLFVNLTGLQGVFDTYLSFLKKDEHRPVFLLGCTSITIPDSYIFLDSGQLRALLEGIAGAAWYSELLHKKVPARLPDNAGVMNTGLGVAHLIIIALVVFGNITLLRSWWRGR